MTSEHNTNFGPIDIPLSCSVFLEPALKKYAHNIAPMTNETNSFVHEWNLALMDILKKTQYSVHLGTMGRKLLSRTIRMKTFPVKCVETAKNVPLHSLHYAIRFSESMNFLDNKIKNNSDIKFVDLGCGFSPLAPMIQARYNIPDVYCIDTEPAIIDIYSMASEKVFGRAPTSISWNDAKHLANEKQLNTITAMGILHYMPLDEQVSRLKFINTNFPNFLVEIKYNNNADTAGENVFNLKRLQKLRMDVENTQTLETTMIQNSLRYLHKFMCALPGHRYFLANDRSLFLSR